MGGYGIGMGQLLIIVLQRLKFCGKLEQKYCTVVLCSTVGGPFGEGKEVPFAGFACFTYFGRVVSRLLCLARFPIIPTSPFPLWGTDLVPYRDLRKNMRLHKGERA